MKLSNFSIRIILGFIIVMMGLLAFALALLSGSIHQDLVFDNQRSMMEEMIRVDAKERLEDLNDVSQDLGLSLQSMPAFKSALNTRDAATLLSLLNNQFHQYFVTVGIIKLEQLILFDENFSVLAESTEGSVFFSQHQQTTCSVLLDRARTRTGAQRMKILHDLCLYDNRPMSAVVVPVGGLRLKGYIMVVTDPTHNLSELESDLGMPLSFRSKDKKIVFQSSEWPVRESDSLISSYEIKTAAGLPILSVMTARNINELSRLLGQARFEVLLISGVGTLFIAVLGIYIMRKTMLNPLNRLTSKLRSLHADQSKMGDLLEVTGIKEMHEITEGFNEMSLKLSDFYQSLEYMAYTDALTELPNRNQFQESLESVILLHKQISNPFALFLIDLDRFKGVNDTLGHHVGDELLKAVSLRLNDILRHDDMVARLGGDEFAAILSSAHSLEDSIIVVRKLLQAMDQPFVVNDHRLTIGLSIGIAMYPEHGEDMHALVSHADIAMYDAKNRNCGFSIYDSAKNKHSLRGLELEQDLFASIKRDELVLYYQPKVASVDGSIIGAEALVRWQHPVHGLVPPDDFIPMAEQTGLIQPLTEWVLNKALEDYSKGLCGDESLGISVNLSTLNLRDDGISETIIQALEKWSISPEVLTLELTESTIMADPEFAIAILTKLDAMGVSLSIDDFGTGHSSLAYVKHLPVDELKIDKSFIKDIKQDSDNEAIVRAVLVLAHHMNLSVVAEGVEDMETLDVLRELGCDVVQGYYFAKPMPFDEYIAWLGQNKKREAG